MIINNHQIIINDYQCPRLFAVCCLQPGSLQDASFSQVLGSTNDMKKGCRLDENHDATHALGTHCVI